MATPSHCVYPIAKDPPSVLLSCCFVTPPIQLITKSRSMWPPKSASYLYFSIYPQDGAGQKKKRTEDRTVRIPILMEWKEKGISKGNINHQEGNQDRVKSEKRGPQRNPKQDRHSTSINCLSEARQSEDWTGRIRFGGYEVIREPKVPSEKTMGGKPNFKRLKKQRSD